MTQGPLAPAASRRVAPTGEVRPPSAPGLSSTTSRLRSWADRAARVFVTGAGIAIIASILAIFAFIFFEVLPLIRPARVTAGGRVAVPGARVLALLGDEHRTHVAALDENGHLHVVRMADGFE